MTFIGEDSNNASGYAVAFGGDNNADGRDDLLIGAPWLYDRGGPYAGRVYWFSGAGLD